MIPIANGVSLVILALACATAVFLDIRTRRLPNWLSLATLVAGLGNASLNSWPQSAAGAIESCLLHAFLALVVGMILFQIRLIGGGDAKFYAAVASWFPLRSGIALLTTTAIAGLIAVLIWFISRRILTRGGIGPKKSDGHKFPLGVAIALGAVLTMALKSFLI